jgi:hypothetical protein
VLGYHKTRLEATNAEIEEACRVVAVYADIEGFPDQIPAALRRLSEGQQRVVIHCLRNLARSSLFGRAGLSSIAPVPQLSGRIQLRARTRRPAGVTIVTVGAIGKVALECTARCDGALANSTRQLACVNKFEVPEPT